MDFEVLQHGEETVSIWLSGKRSKDGSRFLGDDPRSVVRFDPLYLPATLMLVPAILEDGTQGYALRDCNGFAVTHSELLQLLVLICPFYANVSAEELKRYNRCVERRYGKPAWKSSADKQPQPRAGYIYLLQAGPYYKIGASNNVERRVQELAAVPPFDLEIVCMIQTDDMRALESELHTKFDAKRVNGEWFELDQAGIDYVKGLGER